MSQNVTDCHTFSNLGYKATFTLYVWIRLGTTQRINLSKRSKKHMIEEIIGEGAGPSLVHRKQKTKKRLGVLKTCQ